MENLAILINEPPFVDPVVSLYGPPGHTRPSRVAAHQGSYAGGAFYEVGHISDSGSRDDCFNSGGGEHRLACSRLGVSDIVRGAFSFRLQPRTMSSLRSGMVAYSQVGCALVI